MAAPGLACRPLCVRVALAAALLCLHTPSLFFGVSDVLVTCVRAAQGRLVGSFCECCESACLIAHCCMFCEVGGLIGRPAAVCSPDMMGRYACASRSQSKKRAPPCSPGPWPLSVLRSSRL
eukprot:scaffold15229_cov163-Isochrysis_galbana.AAC.2